MSVDLYRNLFVSLFVIVLVIVFKTQTSPCGLCVNRIRNKSFVSLFVIVFFKCRLHLVEGVSLSIELYITMNTEQPLYSDFTLSRELAASALRWQLSPKTLEMRTGLMKVGIDHDRLPLCFLFENLWRFCCQCFCPESSLCSSVSSASSLSDLSSASGAKLPDYHRW